MAIPPLVLRIYADSSGVKRGVAQAQTQVSGLRASVARNASLIKTGLAVAVVAGMAAAIKSASDLTESQNKANVVFGKSVGAVNNFAKSAATGFGIAKAEALGAAASFGAMFDSAGLAEQASAQMSITMSRLAGDMASFNNADPSDMLERLRGGLAGEAEPLRRFGVFISEARVQTEAMALGLERVNGKFTDAQKIQARYNIILKDTKKQQGDFQRTLGESFPNQLRVLRAQLINLAATVGKLVLPALTGLLKVVNFLLGPLQAIAEVLASSAWDRFGAALQEAGLSTEQTTQKVKDMKTAMDDSNASGRQLGGAMAVVERQTRVAAEEAEGWAMRQRAVQAELDATNARAAALGRGIIRFTDITEEDWKKWVTEALGDFDAVKTGMDNLANKAKLTATKIINEFNRQARNIRDYRQNLQDVAARNIPDAILQQLIDMGIGGAGILAELANASDQKFNRMVGAMRRAGRETRALERQIRDLREQLLAVEGTYNATIRITQTGAVNAAGLIAGQRQHGGPVQAMRPYIVGERGPELFIPKTAGTVVASKAGGNAGGRLSISIDRRRWVNEADYEAAYGGVG